MEKLWRRRSSGEAQAVPACGKWFKQHPLRKACRLRALENHPDKFKRPKQQQVCATAEMQIVSRYAEMQTSADMLSAHTARRCFGVLVWCIGIG